MKISEKDLRDDYGRYLQSLVTRDAGRSFQVSGVPFIWGIYYHTCISVVPINKEYETVLHMSWFFRIHRIPQDLLRIIYRSFLSHRLVTTTPRSTGITMLFFRSISDLMDSDH